jgi:hypothetical protein
VPRYCNVVFVYKGSISKIALNIANKQGYTITTAHGWGWFTYNGKTLFSMRPDQQDKE